MLSFCLKAQSYEFIAIICNYFPFIVLPAVVLWLGIQDEINKFFGCTIRTEYFFVESVTCRGDTASGVSQYFGNVCRWHSYLGQ